MKKTLLVVFSMLLSTYGMLYAQGVSGGIKGGLNLASQSFDDPQFSVDSKAKAGLHLGVYATIMLSEKFGIQPEVLYSSQGTKFKDVDDASYKFNYINIPLLLRYNFNKMVNLHLGPQFGILASAKSEIGSTEEDIKDAVKGSDLSAAFGLGVDLPMGLNFSVRYSLGLSDIDEDSNAKAKNNNIQVSVGYRLFGKKD